jgi:hypothetical protein
MKDQTPSQVPVPEGQPDRPEEPTRANSPTEDPTSSAYLKVTTLGPTTVEARGTVPLIFVAGILGAVVTVYFAAHASARDLVWFLGLAGGQLALAGAVIFRVTRRTHQGKNSEAPGFPGGQLHPSEPLHLGNRERRQSEELPPAEPGARAGGIDS